MPKRAHIDDFADAAVERIGQITPGHDIASLGPSDSSDSGSDLMGLHSGVDSTSDRHGTGERASAGDSEVDDDVRADADIVPDRVVDSSRAGLGGGLDQAEEAQLGITDEQLEELDFDDDE
ncbi:MAG TPA: hypothetical protein VMF52_09335 [Steroidobacteraceae bacterium]|nr:hypothetical protein [Steroidobacteraceae bacterium]